MPINNPFDDTYINELADNIVEDEITLTKTEQTVSGVRQVTLSYSAHEANIGENWYRINAGSVLLNSANVTNPTTFYIYTTLVSGAPVVQVSITNPEEVQALEYMYAWIAIVRMKSVGGTATIYYWRTAYAANKLFLHYIGEYDYYTRPTWIEGGGLTINATTGVVDMETLDYRRMRFDREQDAITAGTILYEDESAAVANLELITTYSDGSAITSGKYHKLLFGVVVGKNQTNQFMVVRQGKPSTEYTSLDEARIDAENVAGTSFPFTYRGGIFHIAYIIMKVGDASSLTTIDLRPTGAGGGNGGGGTPIADHDALTNLGTTSHDKYLLIDGSRALTGNMAVNNGVTIDGVDISVHAANTNAHHNAVTLGVDADTLLGLSTQQLTLDNQSANRVFAGPATGAATVPTFRALVAADIPAVYGTMPYAVASDTTTQSIANIANAQVVTFNTSELLSGITRTSSSRYTIITPGTYGIILSAIGNLAAQPGNKHLELWLRVNGSDVARSNTRIEIVSANVEMILAVDLVYTFTAGQYFEIWTWGDSTNCQWLATAAATGPTRPACPSIIMTVKMISSN